MRKPSIYLISLVIFGFSPLPATGLVINEIDYDQAGDDDAEFIELYNNSEGPVSLDGFTLHFVNGSNDKTYRRLDLPAVDVPPGGYYVVCGNSATVDFCDLDVSPDTHLIQNGSPDAIALFDATESLVDTVSYEGDTIAPYTEGSGGGPADYPADLFAGISRFPNGVDNDENAVDFSARCMTPGEANIETVPGDGQCLGPRDRFCTPRATFAGEDLAAYDNDLNDAKLGFEVGAMGRLNEDDLLAVEVYEIVVNVDAVGSSDDRVSELWWTIPFEYNEDALPTVVCFETVMGGTEIDMDTMRYPTLHPDKRGAMTYTQFRIYDNVRRAFDLSETGFLYTDYVNDVALDANRKTLCRVTGSELIDPTDMQADPRLQIAGTGLLSGGAPFTAEEVHAFGHAFSDQQHFTNDQDPTISDMMSNGAPRGVIIPVEPFYSGLEQLDVGFVCPLLPRDGGEGEWWNTCESLLQVFTDGAFDPIPRFAHPVGAICGAPGCETTTDCLDDQECFVGQCIPAPIDPIVLTPGDSLSEAIAEAEDGGTILLTPGEYRANVLVANKEIHIIGAGSEGPQATTLRAATGDAAVLLFERGGGGSVQNVAVHDGLVGISGLPTLDPLCPDDDDDRDPQLPGRLVVSNVRLSNNVYGISGSFSDLEVRDTDTSNNQGAGLSITSGFLQVELLTCDDNEGPGLLVNNVCPSLLPVLLNGLECHGNSDGGLVVVGSGAKVVVTDSQFIGNDVAGVIMLSVGLGPEDEKDDFILNNVILMWNLAIGDDELGDGLDVIDSIGTLANSGIGYNARAGTAVFGPQAELTLEGDTFIGNRISLNYELGGTFYNGLGNRCDPPGYIECAANTDCPVNTYCGDGVDGPCDSSVPICLCTPDPCHALSSNLDPPSPL